MEELASSIKKKKRLQENKKHEHNYTQKYEEKIKTPLDRPITKIINQIQINETNNDQIKIDEELKKVTLDTGSEINLISKEKAITLGLALEHTAPVSLKNFNGIITEANEITKITFDYKGIILTTDFYVVDCVEIDTIIVGKHTIEELERKKTRITTIAK